jgi:holo-[acyl-carrier protein] synthase
LTENLYIYMHKIHQVEGGLSVIVGIGIDVVEISRIGEIIERQTRFADRILTAQEKGKWAGLTGKRRVEYLAGRFAAKEAFSKAVGTGIGKNLSFLDIEVATDEHGKPYIVRPFSNGVHLSITHSRDFAAAQVIIEKTLE